MEVGTPHQGVRPPEAVQSRRPRQLRRGALEIAEQHRRDLPGALRISGAGKRGALGVPTSVTAKRAIDHIQPPSGRCQTAWNAHRQRLTSRPSRAARTTKLMPLASASEGEYPTKALILSRGTRPRAPPDARLDLN